MSNYIKTLEDELAVLKARLAQADSEGIIVLKKQIRQVERDIKRNSMRNTKSAFQENYRQISALI